MYDSAFPSYYHERDKYKKKIGKNECTNPVSSPNFSKLDLSNAIL